MTVPLCRGLRGQIAIDLSEPHIADPEVMRGASRPGTRRLLLDTRQVKGVLGVVLVGLWELAGGELGPPALGRLRIGRYGDHGLDEVAASGGRPRPDRFAVLMPAKQHGYTESSP